MNRIGLLGLVMLLLLLPADLSAQGAPRVHVVMFYSSSCTHCQQVLQETIPPIRQAYHDQLDLLLLDTGNRQMRDALSGGLRVLPGH
jgi:thiol-disulfide isomerase/thioredoxin